MILLKTFLTCSVLLGLCRTLYNISKRNILSNEDYLNDWDSCCLIIHNSTMINAIYYMFSVSEPCSERKKFPLLFFLSNQSGIIFAVFEEDRYKWYNMATEKNTQLCKNILKSCQDVFLMDVIITSSHLLIMTNKGLLISSYVYNSFNKKELVFSLISILPDITSLPATNNIKLVNFRYSLGCIHKIAPELNFEETVLLYSTKLDFFLISRASFKQWIPFSFPTVNNKTRFISAVFYEEKQHLIILQVVFNNSAKVSIVKYPELIWSAFLFTFPDSFKPIDLLIYPENNIIYVIGNQVWLSEDGGYYFIKIKELQDDEILIGSHSILSTEEIMFATRKNKIILSNPGTKRLSIFGLPEDFEEIIMSDIQINFVFFIKDKSNQIIITTLIKSTEFTHFLHRTYSLKKLFQFAQDTHPSVYCFQPVSSTEVFLFQYQFDSFSNEAIPFPSFFIGKMLHHSLGGNGIITHVYKHNLPKDFIAAIRLQISSPFLPYSTLPFNTDIISNGGRQVYILSKNKWHSMYEGYTLIDEDYVSILLTKYESPSKMNGLLIKQINVKKLHKKKWNIFKFHTSLSSHSWYLTENKCQHILSDISSIIQEYHFLDIGDKLNIKIKIHFFHLGYIQLNCYCVVSNICDQYRKCSQVVQQAKDQEIYYFAFPIYVLINNPFLFRTYVVTKYLNTAVYFYLHLKSNRNNQDEFTPLIFNLLQASLNCVSFLKFKIFSCCPKNKYIRFIYPHEIGKSFIKNSGNIFSNSFFHHLPPNYRPPSKYGIGVPISKNIYNADPSKLRYHDKIFLSQFTGTYKQCYGKNNRSHCFCSDEMKQSSLEENSDCKEKVITIRHQVPLPLQIILYCPGNKPRALNHKEFVDIMEVNNRNDFQLLDQLGNELQVKAQSYFSPKISFLFQGSGLYHFRLTVHPSFSKCHLTEEFQVFAVPLDVSYPLYYLWNCLIYLFTAIILLACYVWFSKTNLSPQNVQQ